MIYKYWVAQSGMRGILLQGKIWTVPFHEMKPSEMEQSKFYRAINIPPIPWIKATQYLFI